MSTLAPAKPGCDLLAAAALLRALAHPMRLRLLCRLREGEVSVGGFEAELGLKQPSLSQQLALLRDATLVSTRREAKTVVYRLADDRAEVILDALRAVQGRTGPSRPQSGPEAAAGAARVEARPTTLTRPQRSAACGIFAMAGWHAVPGGRT